MIKRTGHAEPFVEEKLHESLRSALHSVRALEGEATMLATRVTSEVGRWLEEKSEVTSRDIRTQASALLLPLHAEAAYAYNAHDTIL